MGSKSERARQLVFFALALLAVPKLQTSLALRTRASSEAQAEPDQQQQQQQQQHVVLPAEYLRRPAIPPPGDPSPRQKIGSGGGGSSSGVSRRLRQTGGAAALDPNNNMAAAAAADAAPVTAIYLAVAGRDNVLNQTCHMARMSEVVRKVLVVWNGGQQERVEAAQATCYGEKGIAEIEVINEEHNTLLNRYAHRDRVPTEAVLLMDDDLYPETAADVAYIYNVWAEHPLQIVGPARRWIRSRFLAEKLVGRRGVVGDYEYAWSPKACEPFGEEAGWNCKANNKFHLTAGAANMVHKSHLQLFMAQAPQPIMEHIFAHRPTCEDIAFHFVVSNSTGLPAVYTKPKREGGVVNFLPVSREDRGGLGMSEEAEPRSWKVSRSDCVNQFVKLYRRLPLVESTLVF